MTKQYTLSYEPRARLLKLELWGVWDAKMMDEFIVDVFEVRSRVEAAAYPEDKGRIMIDLSNYGIQPHDITVRIAPLLPVFGTHANRIAVIKSVPKLQNMLVDRLIDSKKVETFRSTSEAMAWLA